METFILIFCLLGLLLLGVHIAIALGASSIIYLFLFTDFSIGLLPPTFFKSINSITLMAIPMFIYSGYLMERVGIVQKLYRLATSLTGWLPAGEGIATMLSCMIFAAISGSSVAVASAMGVIAIPNMRKLGYDDTMAAGLIAVGGTLGILIPPSLSMIIFGIVTDTSIPKLFLAGMVPGILLGLALCVNILILGRIKKLPSSSFSAREVVRCFGQGIWGLLMPLVVLGGIYGGVFTPTEAAAVAAFYAVVYGLVACRKDCRKLLPNATRETLQMSAMIFLILGGAMAFGMVLTIDKIPDSMAQWIIGLNLPKWAFLIAINLFYLFMGCFLDVISCILLTVPFVFPVTQALQIDPLHFATFLTINMELACITPPVGFNLYVLSGVAGVPIWTVIRGTLPFMAVMFCFLIIVTWIPWLSTWLPGLF